MPDTLLPPTRYKYICHAEIQPHFNRSPIPDSEHRQRFLVDEAGSEGGGRIRHSQYFVHAHRQRAEERHRGGSADQ